MSLVPETCVWRRTGRGAARIRARKLHGQYRAGAKPRHRILRSLTGEADAIQVRTVPGLADNLSRVPLHACSYYDYLISNIFIQARRQVVMLDPSFAVSRETRNSPLGSQPRFISLWFPELFPASVKDEPMYAVFSGRKTSERILPACTVGAPLFGRNASTGLDRRKPRTPFHNSELS